MNSRLFYISNRIHLSKQNKHVLPKNFWNAVNKQKLRRTVDVGLFFLDAKNKFRNVFSKPEKSNNSENKQNSYKIYCQKRLCC